MKTRWLRHQFLSNSEKSEFFFIGLRIKPNCLVVSVLAEFSVVCGNDRAA